MRGLARGGGGESAAHAGADGGEGAGYHRRCRYELTTRHELLFEYQPLPRRLCNGYATMSEQSCNSASGGSINLKRLSEAVRPWLGRGSMLIVCTECARLLIFEF